MPIKPLLLCLSLVLANEVCAQSAELVCIGKKASKSEIVAIYLGDTQALKDGTRVTAYMLPPTHPLTKDIFTVLDISPVAVSKRALANSLVDSGLRVVVSTEKLVTEMDSHSPSFGYTDSKWGFVNVTSCN